MPNSLKDLKDSVVFFCLFSPYRPGSCDSVILWATVPNITPTSCLGLLPPWCGNSVLLRTRLIGKTRENIKVE